MNGALGWTRLNHRQPSRRRAGHGAKSIAAVRHFALNPVRHVADKRPSRDACKRATWDPQYVQILGPLIYSCEMHLGDKKISVSLATVEFTAEDERTTLRVTEQGAFLDGYDDAGSREHRPSPRRPWRVACEPRSV